MRGRTVLILLVLVVGLVAFIELYEGELPSSTERAELEKLVFGELQPGDIDAIEIARQGVITRVERRPLTPAEGGEWWLTEPLEGRADSELVDGLIDSLASLEKSRTLVDTSRAEAGLDPPRLTVALISPTAETVFEVGSEVPAGSSMIAAVNDEILVVDGLVWTDLARAPGDWRSRQVVHRTEAEITGVTLTYRDSQIVFGRRGTDFWIEAPIEDRVDAARMGDLLTEVASMRKATFVDDPSASLGEMGVEPPVGTVELWSDTGGDAPSRILWGVGVPSEPARHYAMSEGEVFTTEADLQAFLEVTPQEWRSRQLTSMETFQIDRLEILQSEKEQLTLVRDGADWQRNQDRISFTTVSELLYAFTDLEVQQIEREITAESLQVGTQRPVLEVTMEGNDRRQKTSFYRRPEGGAFATIEDRHVALRVGENEFAEVLAKLAAVRTSESTKTNDDE